MRNRSLVTLAEQSICTSTAKVYAEVLRRLESKVRDCKEEIEAPDFGDGPELHALPQLSTDDILAALRHSTDLANAFGDVDASRVNLTQSDHPKKRRRKNESDSEDEVIKDGNASRDEDDDDSESEETLTSVSSDSEEEKGEAEYDPSSSTKPRAKAPEDPQLNTIRDHLLLLAQHPYQFLHHFPETPILPEKWTVYFPPLMAHLIHHTLLRTITSRYGLHAARLTRLLSEKGKVDEKNLCSLSLLNQKTMRSYLTTLHQAGMIQLQEVPRDNSRNPQRTLYLWFFDIERCKSKMLQETYKTMARCLQRVRVEGDKVKSTVEKASRTDVMGREEEFLGVQEREALSKWREVEERIWGEVARLDEMVATMRDF
jgi:DNA-directed RNA polymerase III subunit RPC3